MDSNDVKITEHGRSLRVMGQGMMRPHTIEPREVAALRAYFAEERVPEDVQALLERVKALGYAHRVQADAGFRPDHAEQAQLFDQIAAALEARPSERDALAAVIEEVRAEVGDLERSDWLRDTVAGGLLAAILSRTPADVLAERDARIRAEVIDWIAGRIRSIPHWWDADTKYGEFDLEPLGPRCTSEQGAYMEVSRAVDDAREHFGLTKGADRG